MATTKLWTIADLDRLDDQHQYELIDGELIQIDMSSFAHTSIGIRLSGYMMLHAESNRLGIVTGADGGIVFGRDPDTMLIPDVAFVDVRRLPPRDTWTQRLELAPDLAVEILSPSNRMSHVQRKLAIYLSAGVRLVWLVDPDDRTVTVHRPGEPPAVLRDGDVLEAGDVLPGFGIPITHVFDPFGAAPGRSSQS